MLKPKQPCNKYLSKAWRLYEKAAAEMLPGLVAAKAGSNWAEAK